MASRYPSYEVFQKLSYRTELMDTFGLSPVVRTWTQYKQVYKIDREFFNEVIKTENLKIPEDTFSYLPVPDMYIDLSECEGLDPIKGAFVHITKDNQFVAYMETADAVTFSFYSDLQYEDGVAEVVPAVMPEGSFFAMDLRQDMLHGVIHEGFENDRRPDIVMAIIQLLMFLSSQKPDVQENELTKKTYRPSSTVRNKFSEIRMWDVGVRYGKAVRLARMAAEKRSASQRENVPHATRKPVRPHVRCAHWQRYHVGKGRKEIRTNWIPPVFVCGGKEIPVTIHDVTQ